MRFLEALIFAINLLNLILLMLIGYRGRWLNYFSGLGMLFVVGHLFVEGYRWQMIPVYSLSLIFFLLSLLQLSIWLKQKTSFLRKYKGLQISLVLMGFLLLIIGAILAVVLPVPSIAAPNGPYQVGTTTFHWVDATREEIYTPNPTDQREIMVQLWYPTTNISNTKPTPWMKEAKITGPQIASWLNLPIFLLNHLNLVQTHAFADVPLATQQTSYPVVIYAHGWGGFKVINVDQVETLASHGYIVVTIDHTYGAMLTVFPDGRIAPINPAALPDGPEDDAYWLAANKLVDVFAGDVQFVLNQLEALNAGTLNADERFTHRLNLEKIGLFGHSTGGGAVVEVCSVDPRCKAILGMDTWVRPVNDAILEQGLSQPALFMRSESWSSGKNENRLQILYNKSTGPRYKISIMGTEHRDFTLLPLMSPLAYSLGLKGPINAKRGMTIINSYLLAFFDKHLYNKSTPLLDGVSKEFAEVTFEKNIP